jgi:hypothetical protein
MIRSTVVCLLAAALLAACSPATPVATPHLLTLHSTYGAEPWLEAAYGCAARSNAALSRVADGGAADLRLRLGEPELLVSPAYEIDRETIVIAAHRESEVAELEQDAARALFSGRGDPSVVVWVYDADADIQQVFDRLVMQDGSVAPTARVAADPTRMNAALQADPAAVGILPRAALTDPLIAVYEVASVPVLAITRAEPEGELEALIGCLQQD